MITHTTTVRVRYADTDQMKFVYYGKYFEYFEQGRSEILRHVGLPYGEIEKMGILLPVIEAHADYKKPAHYDDLLTVECTINDMPVARIRVDYKVFREGDLLLEGYTVHGFTNAATGKPTRAPAVLVQAIEEGAKKR